MKAHQLWHVLVLASTLLAIGGLAMVVLAPLLFDESPAALTRGRPLIVVLIVVAAALLAWEWQGAH